MIDIGVLIAVRGGSKRVLNKNIRPFAGTTLLENKIEQAKRTGFPVYVSTEDSKMQQIASTAGARVFDRDPFYATDSVPMGDVYVHLADAFPHEHIIYMPVTSPLLNDNTLNDCISLYFEEVSAMDYDSVVTTTAIKEYLWEGEKPVNYDPLNHPRSQDLPDIYALNFAVNILRRETMTRKKNILGDRFAAVEIDKIESIDIDEEDDFVIAEILFEKQNKLKSM